MIALRLVRLIENHSDELARELINKLHASARTTDMQKVPEGELRGRIHEILQHLSEWLLTKTATDIETRFRDLGAHRAAQGFLSPTSAGPLCLPKNTFGNFCNGKDSCAAPSRSTESWNYCAYWINSSIVLSATPPKDTSNTPLGRPGLR